MLIVSIILYFGGFYCILNGDHLLAIYMALCAIWWVLLSMRERKQ